MKLRKIIAIIIFLALILLSWDFFTMTDKWRFYGWEMFTKGDSDIMPKSLTMGPARGSEKSGQGILPDSPYVFTAGWFLLHILDWEQHLRELKGKPNIHALEIGSYEGFSAIWQLENILSDPSSTITCIDIFDEKEIEARFDRNVKATGVAHKVKKVKGSSEIMLRGLNLEQYDYVYIDGCHLPKWVLSDAVLSWDLLKKGGLMIFDDYKFIELKPPTFRLTRINFIDNYLWKKWMGESGSSKPAVDAFLKIYGPYLDVVFKKYQVVVKKK